MRRQRDHALGGAAQVAKVVGDYVRLLISVGDALRGWLVRTSRAALRRLAFAALTDLGMQGMADGFATAARGPLQIDRAPPVRVECTEAVRRAWSAALACRRRDSATIGPQRVLGETHRRSLAR